MSIRAYCHRMRSMTGQGPEALEPIGILPLRNSVLFPMSVVPINVGRPRSINLVEQLVDRERSIVGVIAQQRSDVAEPTFEDLYGVGTLARVVKVIRLGDGNYSVVLNGSGRFRLVEPVGLEPYMQATIQRIIERPKTAKDLQALGQELRDATREMLELTPDLPKETASILDNVRDPGALCDLIASNLTEEHASVASRQSVLEAVDVRKRLTLVLGMVRRQLEVLRVKREISGTVEQELTKSQRELALRQQIRTIREELGESAEDDDVELLRDKVAAAGLPPEAAQVARKQLGRLSGMAPQSSEYQVTRTYVEWIVDLPWTKTTADRVDVGEARRCLEEDHFGLEVPKKRIVEYTAIRQLRRDKKGPILLFVGPPGVGKTSLGRSIARAMGRRYGRIALGGVRDEAEIRGHRRTYVGALPGRIIQALKKVGTRNPVLVLDEVDKLGADVHGDPAAALLEVLDPAQNDSFVDHYIDLPFDLSQVVFLATANYFSQIPEALRDRMEVIELPGYTRTEKRSIAEQFLVPKQLREHGLTSDQLSFTREAIEHIVDHYTREPGVRGLERELASICRALTVRLADGTVVDGVEADPAFVTELLGPAKREPEELERELAPGVAIGLSLTSGGGELLFVEATSMPGKGEIRVTGGLQSIMMESAQTAVSFVRSRSDRLGLDPEWLRKIDLHVHVPRAGEARDGASAGVAIFVAVSSLELGAPVRSDVAVVGELTLRGAILPVPGVKDRLLAAHRAHIRDVVLPARNERDLEELPDEARNELRVHLVHHVDEVLPIVLRPPSSAGSTVPPPSSARPDLEP